MLKMLSDLKFNFIYFFEILFLLGFPLSRGTTRAVYTKLGEMLCPILELIDLVKVLVKKSATGFINFWRNMSIPAAFLEFKPFISFFSFRFINKMKTKFFSK